MNLKFQFSLLYAEKLTENFFRIGNIGPKCSLLHRLTKEILNIDFSVKMRE